MSRVTRVYQLREAYGEQGRPRGIEAPWTLWDSDVAFVLRWLPSKGTLDPTECSVVSILPARGGRKARARRAAGAALRIISTRRTAPCSHSLIPTRAPHGVTPRS